MRKINYKDGSYWEINSDYHLGDAEWKAAQLASLWSDCSMYERGEDEIDVCEVGCGVGGVLNGFIKQLQLEGCRCRGTGYDISPHSIEKGRSLFPGINLENSDLFKIAINYDLLLLVDVLEHVESPDAFLNRCFKLSPLVLIHLPLDDNYWERLIRGKGYFEYLRTDRGHIHYYNKIKALNLIRTAGGKVIKWKYTPWGIEHDFDSSRTGKIVKFLRSVGFLLDMDISVRLLGGASIAVLCEKT